MNEEPDASTQTPQDADAVLDRALGELRQEIEQRLPARVEAGGTPFDPMALFDELRRRAAHLGMSERSFEVDEFGLDTASVEQASALLDFLVERYWRVDVSGLGALEEEGRGSEPFLFVANRSGLLPYDGLVISHLVSRRFAAAPRPRFMVADWLVTLPFAQPLLARLGGVRACRENAERLLRTGRSVVAFPEGMKGAAKVFRERYRVQRFGRGGVVRVALATRRPLVPVAVVGAEEAHPILFKVEVLARMAGLPFVPVTPTFPLLGPLGLMPLPTKWKVVFGAPIPTEHLGAEAERDELLVSRLTEELRTRIQERVSAALQTRESIWS
jgi:1-acyl-sn-glycerol-3-phosphate acyltransferase